MTTPETSRQDGQQHRQWIDADQQEESCRSCFYTGVGTCVGLSSYFLYLAMEKEPHQTHHKRQDTSSHQSTKMSNKTTNPSKIPNSQSISSNKSTSFETSLMKFMKGNPAPKRNRPFLFAFSAAWAAAGAYRLYLD